MKKIELSISTAMSLLALSSAGAGDDNEVEEDFDDALSMSDEDFENFDPDDLQKQAKRTMTTMKRMILQAMMAKTIQKMM